MWEKWMKSQTFVLSYDVYSKVYRRMQGLKSKFRSSKFFESVTVASVKGIKLNIFCFISNLIN